VKAVIHLGAITDTNTQDLEALRKWNLEYSQWLWQLCVRFNIPFIYASSASTYGSGKQGYSDDLHLLNNLKPLNHYGNSKHAFDLWVQKQPERPPQYCGFKFFNVYGPYEHHKNKMASVVFNGFLQIKTTQAITLFKSHHPDYADGHQKRDFIYVGDIVDVIHFALENKVSGLYNLGTGHARTFLDLAHALFTSMKQKPHISFVNTPGTLQAHYQYFTQADLTNLRKAGYQKSFTPLEEGVEKTICTLLNK
jgi:ADP-L-glycero-D-manno-heptose 6-epimerase